jgi:hypothetical protein
MLIDTRYTLSCPRVARLSAAPSALEASGSSTDAVLHAADRWSRSSAASARSIHGARPSRCCTRPMWVNSRFRLRAAGSVATAQYVAMLGTILRRQPEPEGHHLLRQFPQLPLLVERQRPFFRVPVFVHGRESLLALTGWALRGRMFFGSCWRLCSPVRVGLHGDDRPNIPVALSFLIGGLVRVWAT